MQNRRGLNGFLAGIVLWSLPACSSLFGPGDCDEEQSLRVCVDGHQFRPGESVIVTLTNVGSSTFFVDFCSIQLVGRVGQANTEIPDPIYEPNLHCGPDATLADVVAAMRILAPDAETSETIRLQAQLLTGNYRVHIWLLDEVGLTRPAHLPDTEVMRCARPWLTTLGLLLLVGGLLAAPCSSLARCCGLMQPGPPYAFLMKGGAAAAGIGQMSEEMKAQGIPPLWNSYIHVEDCTASEKQAADLGGTVTVPTMEVPGHGKLCYIMDPQGTSIAMWQPIGSCTDMFVAEPGGLSWNELLCRDVPAAREFYGQMFGWEFADMPMGDIDYTMIKNRGVDAGGMMAMDGPQFEGIPNHWAVYFAVADCEASANMTKETGGAVRVPPTEIPVGKFSVLGDPQGGSFSIIEMTQTQC